jgi:hypothetical protein
VPPSPQKDRALAPEGTRSLLRWFIMRWLLIFVALSVGEAGICPQVHTHAGATQGKPLADSSPDSIRRNLAKSEEDRDAILELFIIGDEAIPSLVNFVRSPDQDVRTHAARGLAYLGNDKGMKALETAIASERDGETRSLMSYFLAGGLVQTKSERHLEFLKASIERATAKGSEDDDEAFPAVSAALALAMTGRSDVLPALRNFQQLGLVDSDEIAKAIRWIENKPGTEPAATGSAVSEEELVRNIVLTQTFFAQGDETSVERLTFNRTKTKVLVSIQISGRHYARGYDVVLANETGAWRITGVWFTWIT